MSLLKTTLLTFAALLAGVAAANAADLPFRKAAPVEYLRVCDAFGDGFFYIPGSDTCLRISGQIRAEYTVRGGAATTNPNAYAYNSAGQVYRRDLTNIRARGYLNADARTQTAYGTLRAYVSLRVTDDTTAPGTVRRPRRRQRDPRRAGRRAGQHRLVPGPHPHGRPVDPRQGLHPVRRLHGRPRPVVLRFRCAELRTAHQLGRQLEPGHRTVRLHGHVRGRLLGHGLGGGGQRAPHRRRRRLRLLDLQPVDRHQRGGQQPQQPDGHQCRHPGLWRRGTARYRR